MYLLKKLFSMVHVWGVISKMDNKRVFYQDFLFEDMPVDKQDNPLVELAVLVR